MVQGGKIGGHISPPSGLPKGKDLPVGKDGSRRYRVKAGMFFHAKQSGTADHPSLSCRGGFLFCKYNWKGYNYEVRFFRH